MFSSDIMASMQISSHGMRAQGTRIRVISENVANASTTGRAPGSDPYRRQTVSFRNHMDRDLGVNVVSIDHVGVDRQSEFKLKLMPGHPAADKNGYVKMPNMNMLTEIMDVREAQRSYEANLGMIENARAMMGRTIDLLRV